jgi:hypothetical protein
MRKIPLLIAGSLLSLTALATEPLNVKTGQWEVMVATEMHGMPPIPEEALAKMPPEQREKLLAMFGSRDGAPPKEHKSMECVTREDLDKPFKPSDEEDCETKVLTSTATTQEIALTCKGEHPSTGRMKVEATSPESMKATMDLTVSGGKEPMQIKTKMRGRWIGPTCSKDDE